MSTHSGRRRLRGRASALVPGAVAALVCALVAPSGVASATEAPSASGYSFTLRAEAVENFVHIFRELAQGVGFSRVTLTREAHARAGRAEAVGAGVWTLLEDEPCLLGCDPPCTSPMVGNPTMARSSFPRSCDDQKAGLFAKGMTPPGMAAAPTPGSAAGEGHAAEVTSFPGLRAGATGSKVSADVGPDGDYVGTAEAYLQNLVTATGRVRSVTSLMRVTAKPDGSLPVVTYAFHVVGATETGGGQTGIDQEGFTLFGKDVPAFDLVTHFNNEVANALGIAGVLGQIGVRLLEPSVGLSDDGTRYRITAPVLLLGAEQGPSGQGLTVRAGGVRVAGGVFEGSYNAPDRARL